MFVGKHFKAVNEFLRKDLRYPSSMINAADGIREQELYYQNSYIWYFHRTIQSITFTENVVDSLSWVESLGQPSSAVLTLKDVKAAACAALTMSDNSFDLKIETIEHMDKQNLQ